MALGIIWVHLHIAEQVVYRISNGELVAEMHDVCVFRP